MRVQKQYSVWSTRWVPEERCANWKEDKVVSISGGAFIAKFGNPGL
jgi:hypothetical protein